MNIDARAIFLAVLTLAIGGCVSAPQTPISLSQDSLNGKTGRVGVAMAPLPKVDTEILGAGCLLCYASAAAANSSLTSYANTLPYEGLPNVKDELVALLRKKGIDAVLIKEPIAIDTLSDNGNNGPNMAKKDFSPLKGKYSIDKLLMVEVNKLGFTRSYANYFPTSDPKASMQGKGYLVNLANNTYEWYMPLVVTKSSDKSWDEPPKFPGLSNAYFQVLEMGKDEYLKSFKN